MKEVLLVSQIAIAITLIATISIQTKGGGLGRSFSSSTSFSRRGLEKLIFKSTFVFAAAFIGVSLIQLVI